ncbi:MAG: thioredoxin-like domain-containing protein [Planctomycetia bacterium]|nr:thioredoxin-like domain-containing protein [Planctomycetia bacterium]
MKKILIGCFILAAFQVAVWGQGRASQVETALQYKPKQQVDYSTPAAEEVANCKLEALAGGLRLVDPNGLTLREFVDTNGDKLPDEWRYFLNGIEVYREIDTNANKKVDIFRWYNMAGTRHGVDANEDGVIDSWQILSVQELSAEIALAVATGNAARFEATLLSADELKSLGLGDEKYNLIKDKLQNARAHFAEIVDSQAVPKNAQWVQFSGVRPSTYAAGSDGAQNDVDYYENGSCVVSASGNDIEIAVGTLIRVGTVWKAIDAPRVVTPDNLSEIAANNVFIRIAPTSGAGTSGVAPNMEELDAIDAKIANASTLAEAAALHAQRADLLEKIAASVSTPDERALWIRNLADGITGAVQQNLYPDGLARLQKLLETLESNEADKELAAYVKFRLISSEYTMAMSRSGVSWMQVRTKWLEDLNAYIEQYPDSPDTPEALLQLGFESENDANDEKALEMYSAIVTRFPNSNVAPKAKGAVTRLRSVGKVLPFTAPVYGLEGKQLNLTALKNKVVVLHFWSSWMSDAVREMDKLKEIQAKYPGVVLFGVNLDSDEKTMKDFIDANRIKWYQTHEAGGMDSRPANLLGIFSVPTIMVIAPDGTVVSRNAMSSELEGIVSRLVK